MFLFTSAAINSSSCSQFLSFFIETLNDITPTIGFSKYLTRHKGIIVSIYDLGGSSKIREIWKQYFAEVSLIVIDFHTKFLLGLKKFVT